MTQDFTISVPDQLWVDSWAGNATKTYTYDGPETVYVEIQITDYAIINMETTELTADEGNTFIVEITAADYPERAQMVVEGNDTEGYEHTYADEVQFDDSVYKKISNPRLSDYFKMTYQPVPADRDQELGLTLELNLKTVETPAMVEALRRQSYVTKYADQYEFASDDQTSVDAYLTAISNHITTLSTAYPWKFIGGVPTNSIPKIPASLVALFNTLPTEG
jgi:hypothetical protein